LQAHPANQREWRLQLTRVAVLTVALATAAIRPAAAEIPLDLTPEELDCQNATFNAGTTYVQQAFGARHDCILDTLKNFTPAATDCFATLEEGGTGDPTIDARLDAAARRLSETLLAKCTGLFFDNLGFPGFCPIEFDGTYDSIDHEVCILTASEGVVDRLLRIEHPQPPLLPVSTSDAGCGDTIGRKSSSMFANEVDTRTTCQQKQLEQSLSLAVDCRAEKDRFDPATGHTPTDNDILSAHNKVLREIANACGRTRLSDLGFPGECTDAVGVEFAVADVVECMFSTHHDEMIRYMDVLSPSTTQCGNGVLDFTEDCDDGDTEWQLGEYCRANCSAIKKCGDINDDGRITATDALFVLQAAVGLRECSLELCDVNGDGQITATDASMLLQVAVGLPVALSCPAPSSLTCGNGVIDEGETCDDGDSSWMRGELCNGRCNFLLCGDPDDSGSITAADARYMLLVALSLATCDLEVCDVDSNGAVSSTDVLKVLAKATGQNVALVCPRN
jgi:hypothetical protein